MSGAQPPPSIVPPPGHSASGGSQVSPGAGHQPHAGGGGVASIAMANPLSVRVTLLRKPEFFSNQRYTAELSEEGDILHDVLVSDSPTLRYRNHPPASVAPVLTFNSIRGPHLVGEFFRALLSFRNQSHGALTRLFFRIEMISPQSQRFVLWDKEVARIEPKQNREVRVDHRFVDAGKYSLNASVSFADAFNESRRLNWSWSVEVARGAVDVGKRVYLLPLHPRKVHELAKGFSAQTEGSSLSLEQSAMLQQHGLPPRLCVAVVLQNTLADSALYLTNVRLVPKEGSCYQLASSPSPLAMGYSTPTTFAHQYTGGWRDSFEDCHLSPGDTRQFMFELTPIVASSGKPVATPPPVSSAAGAPGLPGSPSFFSSGNASISAGSTANPAASTKSLDIGHVEWEWRRANGDGGVDTSAILRVTRSTVQRLAETDVYCVGVVAPSVGISEASDGSSSSGGSAPIRAGSPCELNLIVVNRSSSRKDVALVIQPTKLLPFVAYTGPVMRPLGLVEGNGELCFTIPVIPLLGGVHSIAGFIELRDARNLATILWPTKPQQTVAPPSLASSPMLGSPSGLNQTALAVPSEPWPPVLCELVVV